jgi:hypothetical protein
MQGSGIFSMVTARKTAFTTLLLLVSSLSAWPVAAVTVTGLYSVEVPVESSQPADLARGYSDGLSRVFVRVSGSRDVLNQEGVKALLDNAESLLQSYQYLRSEERGNRLQMSFGAVGVNSALASVDAPVWGANRPLTLAWIAVESGGSRTLLHERGESGQSSTWRDAFRRAAENRGLPVALPPEEYADRDELMSDVWGQFTSRVKTASETLNHDLISLVRVRRADNGWRAGWVFDGMALEGPEQSLTASSPGELAEAVVGRWADSFAERYAVDGSEVGESPQVDIVVHGIDGLEAYAQANRVLKNLSPVQNAGSTATRDSRVTIRVAFSGEIGQLQRYIALDPRLVPLSEAEVSRLPPGQDQAGGEAKSNPQPQPTETAPTSAVPVAPITDSSSSPDRMLAYDTLLIGEDEADQAFESLYQVLHYRWQSAPVIGGERGE